MASSTMRARCCSSAFVAPEAKYGALVHVSVKEAYAGFAQLAIRRISIKDARFGVPIGCCSQMAPAEAAHLFGSNRWLFLRRGQSLTARDQRSRYALQTLEQHAIAESECRLMCSAREVPEAAGRTLLPQTPLQPADAFSSARKPCNQCGQIKLLVDFETIRVAAELRTDVCRACLGVLRAKKRGAPLFHLALSIEQSQQQAKGCKTCGHVKELRDFTRDRGSKDGTRGICRACHSLHNAERPTFPPTYTPKECIDCREVKSASSFGIWPQSPTGRHNCCKLCVSKRSKEQYGARKARAVLRVESKVCRMCLARKPALDFSPNKSNLDGLVFDCKECCNARKLLRTQAARSHD